MSKIKIAGDLFYAQEMIDFQHDNFGTQLEMWFKDVKEYLNSNPNATRKDLQKETKFPLLLEELIFKRFGIKTNVMLDTTTPGAVMPFFINKNHVLIDKMWRGEFSLPDQEKILKTANNKKGSIDLIKAKVDGIFSKYVHDLWLDIIGNFENELTGPEQTAILLHEIGHAFTYYEFSDRLSATNQVLAELSKEVKGSNDPKKRDYLFKELAKITDIDPKEFDELIEENNNTIMGVKLFRKYVQFVQSLLPNDKYSDTSSEQLADNFAARFGYGRQLITGLDRFYKYAPERHFGVRIFSMIYSLLSVIGTAIGIISSFMSGGITAGVFYTIVLGLAIYGNGSASRDMTYDELKLRYIRIRHQYIEMINRLDISREQLQNIVDNVHAVDEIINNTAKVRFVYQRIADFVITKHRDAKNDIQLQQLLETITHSDLFLKSAELKLQA